MKTLAQPNRRRMRIVDHALQRSLLVALVVMETVIVAAAIWALYRALAAIVDENLYRVHFHGGIDMLSLLIDEVTPVLGAMLAINFVALVIADRIWARYVDGIVSGLDQLMDVSAALDFSPQEPPRFDHAVLEQALYWRGAEAERLALVRRHVRALPAALPDGDQARAQLAAALAALRHD